MNYVENLESDQWRKLFNIYNSSSLQHLNIFGAREDFIFQFTCLSGVWKSFNRTAQHVSGTFLFDRPGRSVSLACRLYSWWPHSLHGERSMPVAVGRRRPSWLGPLTTSPGVTEAAITHFALSPPSFSHVAQCSAPCQPPRACPQHRLAKSCDGTSPPSSSSTSTSPVVASSTCSPTPSTSQGAPCRQGGPPRPPLRPPRPLPQPLTGVSSPSARAPP
jgi:hypothetical protein